MNRQRLRGQTLHAQKLRKKKRDEEKNRGKNKGRRTNKTEAFHSFFHSIIPHIKEIWIDRCTCIDRNTPIVGGRIVAEYDALTRSHTIVYNERNGST